MHIISKKKQETLILTFIDQQTSKQISQNKQILVPQTVKDDVSIDFTQMLQRQWNVQPDQVLLNSKAKTQSQKARKIQKTAKTFKIHADNGGLVSSRFKKSIIKLLNVQTIFDTPIEQEDIDQFLQSSWFKMSIRIFIIIYIVGLGLTDYSFRLPSQSHFHQTSVLNTISLHFQLFANCAFTIQILLKMFSKNMFFENPWNILNLIGCLSCWSTIFLDVVSFDQQPIYHAVYILKILLGIRIVQMFQFIKGPFESFITTIPQLGKIFFPYLIFVVMYSVLGLILFMGANQQRCRETPQPINGQWPEVPPSNLCGSEMYHCQVGYCGNPYTYDLPFNYTQKYQYQNQFGLVSFDNMANAALTTYHYMFLASWTAIMFKYSKYMNPYLTIIYFFSSAIFLFFIMANLNMITLCKAFIEKEKSKQKFNIGKQPQSKSDQHENLLSKMTQFQFVMFQILRYIEIILMIVTSIVILIEYEQMSRQIKSILNKADFFLTLLCLLGLIFRIILLKRGILHEKFAILDLLSIMISIGDFIYCAASGTSVIDPSENVHRLLRGIKIIRIIKILYFAKTWFVFEKTILKIFVQTLNSVKSFFFLLFSVILIFAFIGQNLFANRVKFQLGTGLVDLKDGQTYTANFDNIYKALISVTYLLENQHWGDIMYMHYIATGWIAVLYFSIAVLLLNLLLARLFIAIFLCYFRRNLQKKNESEEEQSEGSKLAITGENRKSKQQVHFPQILQNQSNNQSNDDQKQSEENQQQKIFWIFKTNHCFFQFLRACYNSKLFHRVMIAMIAIHCLTIIARTNLDQEAKKNVLDIVECIPLYFYIFEFLVGVIGFGLFWGSKTYLKQSKMNYINIVVTILVLVSEFDFMGQMQAKIIRRCAIIKILTLFTRINKQTTIMLDSISAIAKSYVRMIGVYIFLLILSCLVPLKLNSDQLYACYNYPIVVNQLAPQNYRSCMLVGGDWIGDSQKFTNILESVVLMYQIVTSQSWIYFIERFQRHEPWDVFFVLNFFIYNICLLNIFVGLTVETFLSLKDKAYKLNLLRPNQRMWLLIRNCINELVPVPIMKQPSGNSKFRKRAYKIISEPTYENFIDILPYLNVFIYALKYYRANPSYINNLDILNIVITIIFMIDTTLKLQLHWNFFYLNNSKVQFCGFIYFIIYGILSFTIHFSLEAKLALQFIGAFFLILRCKKLIFRFTWCKTLLNSVIQVLPKCVIIGTLLGVVLFFYISIGMEIFKHTKPTSEANGYTTGFNNAFTSLVTLLKIVSNQTWFFQVSVFARVSTPADVCFPVSTIADSSKYSQMGCGTIFSYFYFISFHMIITLLVLNLLIATMTAAYDENYEKQYKSVNIFQLQDCLKLWQKYDPDGTGLIAYKKFWRLSSQIAILFGISKKKLIKSKQKFLQELDIEICESTDPKHTSVLCYKFHDVLIKFSKIKLTVSKNDTSEQSSEAMDFQIHPMIEREIKDYITKAPQLYDNIKTYKNLKSGQMKYFFGLLRKMRAWKIVAKKKDSSAISKLSHIIKVALEKKQREEVQITRIRNSMSNFLAPIIS